MQRKWMKIRYVLIDLVSTLLDMKWSLSEVNRCNGNNGEIKVLVKEDLE